MINKKFVLFSLFSFSFLHAAEKEGDLPSLSKEGFHHTVLLEETERLKEFDCLIEKLQEIDLTKGIQYLNMSKLLTYKTAMSPLIEFIKEFKEICVAKRQAEIDNAFIRLVDFAAVKEDFSQYPREYKSFYSTIGNLFKSSSYPLSKKASKHILETFDASIRKDLQQGGIEYNSMINQNHLTFLNDQTLQLIVEHCRYRIELIDHNEYESVKEVNLAELKQTLRGWMIKANQVIEQRTFLLMDLYRYQKSKHYTDVLITY